MPQTPLAVQSGDFSQASITMLARAFSAQYVVDLKGKLVADFSSSIQSIQSIQKLGASDVTNAARIFISDGELASNDTILLIQLRKALFRLSKTSTQYVCPNGIHSIIVLRKVVTDKDALIFVCPPVASKIAESDIYEFGRIFGLTLYQSDVLRELCEGTTPERISEQRKISITTVRSHIRNLLRKTKAADTRTLIYDVRNILMR
jgi:DNA-binding NarL/FixJ family response regulator